AWKPGRPARRSDARPRPAAPDGPALVSHEIGVLTALLHLVEVEALACVVQKGVVVVRLRTPYGDQRAAAGRPRLVGEPAAALAEGTGASARARARGAGLTGPEEYRSTQAQPIRGLGRVASEHLRALDHPDRHGRQIGAPADVVVDADARQINGDLRAVGAADRGGRQIRLRPGA